ncbi:MAG: universal stress protein [Spirochaetes bacterium]|nr:universal stress protein [Spirochaetota bacterium]HNV43398.1 universal stress protein [Exilispira sp.]MBP8991482.1 universal stress protein [Spirochaetota bacterium]HOV46840.1 universal stress protein [Exilispira sp.]HPB48089.1 universal stress protein [Exilispira sp.]
MEKMNILVPLDVSKNSNLLAKYAEEIGKRLNGKLVFYHVIDERNLFTYNAVYSFPEYYPEIKVDPEVEKQIKENTFNQIKKILEDLQIKDIEYSIVVEFGIPYIEICEYATDNNFDLVIIGSHGKTNLKDIFLGSVVDYISHHISKPVLIYKIDESKRI